MAAFRRWIPLAASLVLLLALGLFGFMLVASSTREAEAALHDTAVVKQQTLATLAEQYLQLAQKEAFDFAQLHDFELTPSSPADAAVLEELRDRQGGLLDHAAVLTDLTGRPLTTVSRTPGVPAPDHPGFAPLRAALLRGEPGVSSVMLVEDVPVVAIGVPVLDDAGTPTAILVAFFRAAESHLQAYSAQLGRDGGVANMVVDRAGTVVAAYDPALVGTPAPRSPAVAGGAPEAGFADFVRDGQARVVAHATEPVSGWTLLEEEPADTFYAAARGQSRTARLVLLAGLLLGAVMAVVLNHRTHRARLRGQQRSQALVTNASDLITIIDGEGRLVYVSPAAPRVLGFDPDALLGTAAIDLAHPDDARLVEAAVVAAADEPGDRQRLQVRVRCADGSHTPCELVISNQTRNPSVRGMVVSMRDVAEVAALHDQLSHQALHDPLTELANRTQLEQRMTETLATTPHEEQVAVLFVDLDGFKRVNDQLGHDRGDELLIGVADRLRQAVREQDLVARLGGDEFVVVLTGPRVEDVARGVAQRILELLAEPFTLATDVVTVGASVGIALGDGDTAPGQLLRAADGAMYVAKERGRPATSSRRAGARWPALGPRRVRA